MKSNRSREFLSNENKIRISHFNSNFVLLDFNLFIPVSAVQHERGPRASTIHRQTALDKDTVKPSPQRIFPVNTMPAPSVAPPTIPLGLPIFPNPFSHYNILNLFGCPSPSIFSPTPLYLAPLLFVNQFRNDNDPGQLCETAARLLILNVNWIKSVVPFESLSLPDRLLLIEESWTELFVLGVAQFVHKPDLNNMLILTRVWAESTGLEVFESVLADIASLVLDHNEHSHLRMLILFKTSLSGDDFDLRSSMSAQDRRLKDVPAVAEVLGRVQTALDIVSAIFVSTRTYLD